MLIEKYQENYTNDEIYNKIIIILNGIYDTKNMIRYDKQVLKFIIIMYERYSGNFDEEKYEEFVCIVKNNLKTFEESRKQNIIKLLEACKCYFTINKPFEYDFKDQNVIDDVNRIIEGTKADLPL